jgi:hypothetical protein
MFRYYRPTVSLERGIETVYCYQRAAGLVSDAQAAIPA